jgi:hypothetical protein
LLLFVDQFRKRRESLRFFVRRRVERVSGRTALFVIANDITHLCITLDKYAMAHYIAFIAANKKTKPRRRNDHGHDKTHGSGETVRTHQVLKL